MTVKGTTVGSGQYSSSDITSPVSLNTDYFNVMDMLVPNATLNIALEITDGIVNNDDMSEQVFTYDINYYYPVPAFTVFNSSEAPISMVITPSYANKTLGTVAKLGAAMNYQVQILNKNKDNAITEVSVVIRIPSCLTFSATAWDALVTSKTIGSWLYREEAN
jgi:hypothetical protein